MSNQQSILCASILILATLTAQASELEQRKAGELELTGQQLLNPKGEIIFHKKVLDNLDIDNQLCSGSETQTMPVIGKCPDIPGYVEVGFPDCTQVFDIPKKFEVEEIAPGFVRMTCELDYANATALGPPSCDYSRCQYIEEPEFPL